MYIYKVRWSYSFENGFTVTIVSPYSLDYEQIEKMMSERYDTQYGVIKILDVFFNEYFNEPIFII